MNEMHTDGPDQLVEQSGVFGTTPMERALQLAARWSALEPHVSQRPAEGRRLLREINAAMESLMSALVASQVGGDGTLRASDELLDATYVLERLEWCVLHRVPYIERPRAPRVG